ncbi:hypothetical protein [Nannocystis pusilla]|uniref:PEGA domain-containing protein n=1 Tax=Nannocystis pusilla TaxID=889268 RepID=A0ABS7U0M3_9BACT|nr:hypothetical protein [Nannocystis pusilla]MBZ5714072.1 hypothetical protein [Nannocystis pusilla]
MLLSALIVALAAPPAAGSGAPAVPWGPLPGQAAPASEGPKEHAPSDMSFGTSASGQVETASSAAASPPEAAPVEPMGPTGPAPARGEAPPPAPGEATLVLTGVGQGGQAIVSSPRGKFLGSFALGPGESIALRGAAGEYVVRSPGAPYGVVVPVVGRARVQVGPAGPAVVADEGPTPGPVVRVDPPAGTRDGNWRRPVAPILSALVPGVGQMVNREYARGAGFLLGSMSLGAASLALALTRDPADAATAGAHGRTFTTDVVGAAGLGLLTGGLHLLYMAQVMDAYAGAIGRRSPRPHTNHKLSLELRRMATVGMRAGDPAAHLYADWNVGVLGQVARRFSVGLTDLSLKFGPGRAALQGGPRLQYRVLERGRVWLSLAAGAIVQGAFASGPPPAVPAGEKAPRTAVVAAVPYGQLDLRLFILDRWSIDIVPRISAPLGAARYYRGDGAIPKQAVTLELGTGLGVYF